ncbi:MAG TPA: thiamine phosphate synthase [Candidatus Sulfotelmatobacter sp.]|nr:thiamine phosphate synthase [Candidatus Sulfotelmatobacter sp.]
MPHRCLLYYITDRKTFAADEPTRRRRLLEKVAEAARAGTDYIQLREKDLPTRELESLAREAIRVLNEIRTGDPKLNTKLLINSRPDVALAVGADGVHLRSEDISPLDVKAIWEASGADALRTRIAREGPLIGVSCHSPDEVRQAEANAATFAVFAPVFEKKDTLGTQPAGLAQLREACRAKIPVLALGGINLGNAQACLEAGASGIAAIRLFQENEIAAIAPQLRTPL